MPHRVAALVLCTLLAASPSALAKADRSDEIIGEVTRSAGGLRSAQAISALVYRLHIKEATLEVDANYFVDRRGRMRIDVYSGDKRVFTECHDGTKGWQMDDAGVAKETSASGRAALWHGTQYPGQILDLSELRARGHQIAFAGTETIDGVAFEVLQLTLSDGFRTFQYIDPATHRIARARDVRAPHPDVDPKKITIETTYSDWRAVDGVVRPFVSVQTDLATGKWLQTATVQSIRTLPALPDSLFVIGSPPQAL
jgi:hypothetical protein